MKTPSLSRVNTVLLFGFGLIATLYFARAFLIPLTFGIVLSMLVLPLCKQLERWGWKRGWAILVCILVILASGTALIAVLLAPIVSFSQDLPHFQSSFQEKLAQLQQFLSQKLHIPVEKQQAVLKQSSSGMQSAGKLLTGLVSGVLGFVTETILVLVYVIFFLMSRERYEDFVVKLNSENDPKEIRKTLHQISQVSAQYMTGRLLSILLLAILYSIGLTAVGLKHAILMGSLAALLTLVPFVGTVLGGLFPAATALFSNSGSGAGPAIAVIIVVQLLDEYFFEPFMVGGKVDISPLASIVGVVVGELIWGVAGMVMFIPLLGMTKIIFDHVPVLQPYGYLIGKEAEPEKKYVQKIKNWFKKKVGK